MLSPLGAGGMGEVFCARDTALEREVAIKVLPDAFVADAERIARFEREARVLASLTHANIAAIYGLERTGGATFLVLELVPGETLADRLALGPADQDAALSIARQITDALDAAHQKGIVHRDLKPANIKITVEQSRQLGVIRNRPRQPVYALHPDGERLVVGAVATSDAPQNTVVLVLNFFDELRRAVR